MNQLKEKNNMPVFIPAAIAVGSTIIKVAIAGSSIIANAVTATVGALPATASAVISKGVAAVVHATPEGVKNFITGIGDKIVHAGEKLQELSDQYKSKEDKPEENVVDPASKANDEAEYTTSTAEDWQNATEDYEKCQVSNSQDPSIPSSTPQQQITASRQSSLIGAAPEPAPKTPVIDADSDLSKTTKISPKGPS